MSQQEPTFYGQIETMFKIGEFAKLGHVSIHMLRHYDRLDMLKPAHTDLQTGYRYYSVQQLPTLNRIMALKDLGFSLEQVARLLKDKISHQEIQGMLKLKEAQIEQHLSDEQLRLSRVKARLAQIQEEGHWQPDEVVVKQLNTQPYLSSGHVTLHDQDLVRLFMEIADTLDQHQLHTNGMGHVVIHGPSDQQHRHSVEAGFVVQPDSPDQLILPSKRTIHKRNLEATDVATMVLSGPRQQIPTCFATIGQWMEINQAVCNGMFREIYLHPGSTRDDNDNVVELQIPIKPL